MGGGLNELRNAFLYGIPDDRIFPFVPSADWTPVRNRCAESEFSSEEQADRTRRVPGTEEMKPSRKVEVAKLLLAAGNFSMPYVRALYAATNRDLLVKSGESKG
jgi:hypothetical protein